MPVVRSARLTGTGTGLIVGETIEPTAPNVKKGKRSCVINVTNRRINLLIYRFLTILKLFLSLYDNWNFKMIYFEMPRCKNSISICCTLLLVRYFYIITTKNGTLKKKTPTVSSQQSGNWPVYEVKFAEVKKKQTKLYMNRKWDGLRLFHVSFKCFLSSP